MSKYTEIVDLNDEYTGAFWLYSEYAACVDLFEVMGEDDNGRLFARRGADNTGDVVDDLAEAEIAAHGSIKWDACSNWDFKTDGRMAHFCGKGSIVKYGEALAACCDQAKKMLGDKWY